jgi:hypothetical protein
MRSVLARQKAQGFVEYGLIVAGLVLIGMVGLNALAGAERSYFLGLPGASAPPPPPPGSTSTPTPTPAPTPTATPTPGSAAFHLSLVTVQCGIGKLPPPTGTTASVGQAGNCLATVSDSRHGPAPSTGTLTWTLTFNGASYYTAQCDMASSCGPNPIQLAAFPLSSAGSYRVLADLGGTLPPGWQVGPQGFWLIVVN